MGGGGRGWGCCRRNSWFRCRWAGKRGEGGESRCLMFHLLFVPRYLDYVQSDLGWCGEGGGRGVNGEREWG